MKHAVHVLRRREEFGDLFLLNFAWDAPPPRAGQFLMVKPERSGVFLARPLSVAFVGDGEIGFLVAKRGRGTEELARMLPGDRAELTGPMGKAWEELLPRPQSLAKPVALVGGGVGIAPLLALQAENEREGKGFLFHIYAGFRTKPDLPFLEQGPESVTATEDGSSGKPGRITDHLEPGRYAAVCTCGPEAMMKAVADKCAGAGVPCLVSLERRMACGVGACLGCTVETASGNRRCCADGPIFPAEEMYPDERT